jgi:DnaJ-class molecular chaperone with C-terminal Zn finger domain
MKSGISVYGIIKKAELNLGDTRVPDVFTIGWKDIAAVVSRNPVTAYDSQDKDKTIKDIALHQLVNEKAMEHTTIIPVKFGTMLGSEGEVHACLEKGYSLLQSTLEKRQEEVELEVVAWCELTEILPTLTKRDSQIRAKQQEIAQKGDSVSLSDKIALGQYIDQAWKSLKSEYYQAILQSLQQETDDVHLHNLADDQMIINAGCLLHKQNEASFQHSIERLDQQLQELVHFRVIGPLPTYSFSTIQIQKIGQDRIASAQQTLGLPANATEEVVHATYRELVKKYHPDTSDKEETGEFQRIHSAYTTLKDFIDKGAIYPELYQYESDADR